MQRDARKGSSRSLRTAPRPNDVSRNVGQSLLSQVPQLTQNWGAFLAFVGIMTLAGIYSVQVARSDVVVIAVTIQVLFAIGTALFARLKKVD
jgi:hypothetical protein